MADNLRIYTLDTATGSFTEISAGGFANPAFFRATPGGSEVIRRYFLRNEAATNFYTDMELKPVQVGGGDLPVGGIQIKLLSGDAPPTQTQWDTAPSNNLAVLISPPVLLQPANKFFPDIGAAASPDQKYYPFWINVSAEQSAPIGSNLFNLQLSFTEGVV